MLIGVNELGTQSRVSAYIIYALTIERLHIHGNHKLRNDRTHCRHIVVHGNGNGVYF